MVYLAATVGKTVGIALSAYLLAMCGFKPPGLNFKSLVMVGFIASVGLTVALFVAGAAYSDRGIEGQIQSQAKLGVLFALLNGAIAVVASRFIDLTPEEVVDEAKAVEDAESGKTTPVGEGLTAEDVADLADDSEDDEFLEHVIAIEYASSPSLVSPRLLRRVPSALMSFHTLRQPRWQLTPSSRTCVGTSTTWSASTRT